MHRPAGVTRLLVSGFDQYSQPSERSTPGASWIFNFDELERALTPGYQSFALYSVDIQREIGYLP